MSIKIGKPMTDQQIIEALIARDEQVTEQFFFGNCRPLFLSIIGHVFSYEVDYDEFVNEFYLHLMENDAYRLRQFQGRSTVYQWMKVVATRFFIAKRNNLIDTTTQESLLDSAARKEGADCQAKITAKIDLEYMLSLMPNKREVYVIRRLILDEAKPIDVARELNVKVSNLYNIKSRAIEALTDIALKEVERYEKRFGK